MKIRYRINTLLFILIPILLLSSCNALKRGDFMRQSDNTLIFTEIGFSVADNLVDNPSLPRDAYLSIKNFNRDIYIDVPYITDTTKDLVISFKLAGKDTVPEFWNNAAVPVPAWDPLISGTTKLDFNEGNMPVPHQVRIGRKDPSTGQLSSFQEFSVNVDKDFQPVILNPHLIEEPAPLDLRIGFLDEIGNVISNANLGTWDGNLYPQWNHKKMDILSAWPLTPGDYRTALLPDYPEGYGVDVRPYAPEKHQIYLPDGIFIDQHGYRSGEAEVTYIYDPPALHISKSGDNGGSGSKTEPLETWAEAYGRIVTTPGVYFSVLFEASETPYDVAGFSMLDSGFNGPAEMLSLHGGYMPGFNDRYEINWDTGNEPRTRLTNSIPGTSLDPLDPTSVLTFDNVPNTFILDGFMIEAPETTSDFGTGVEIRNAQPRLFDCFIVAPQGDSPDSTGITIVSTSAPSIQDCVVVGKMGGSDRSTGIRIDDSDAYISESFIMAGDMDNGVGGISTIGIDATDSFIDLSNSHILAGFDIDNFDSNNRKEADNRGIQLVNTDLTMANSWISTGEAESQSVAVDASFNTGSNVVFINSCSLFTRKSDEPAGLLFSSTTGTGQLYLFNSVISVGGTTDLYAAGVDLNNMGVAKIMGNAIHVKQGVAARSTYGIYIQASNSEDIRNNFIWSDSTDDFLGINSDVDISTIPIHHNNFWDTDDVAELDMGTVDNIQDIHFWHSSLPNNYGNISIPVPVDLKFSYDTGDLDVGRINGPIPDEVQYGGEDLSEFFEDENGDPDESGTLVTEYPYNTDVGHGDKRDRVWRSRTGDSTVGWSMGPYEYGNDSYLPSNIFVAEPSEGGDDGHPLGTQDAPFATLTRAYDIARTAAVGWVRNDVIDIRMAQGIYNTSTMPPIASANGINIRGGYRRVDWNRDPSLYVTELQNSGSEVLIYESIDVGPDHLLEGFNIVNTATTGTTDALVVRTSARPTIQNNVLSAGDGIQSRGLTVQGSSPRVIGNIINGGTSTGESVGVWLLNSPNTELDGNDIKAGSGNLSRGIYIQNSSDVTVESNRIYGGASNLSYGVYLLDAPNSSFYNNTILGGTGSETYGIYLQNNGPHYIDGNAIYGGNGSSTSYGLRQINASNAYIANNMIHGGNSNGAGGITRGVDIDAGGDLEYIYNNTIFGGFNSNSDSAAIHTTNSAAPYMINNIIIAGVGVNSASSFGYWQETNAAPTRFLNNILISLDPSSIPYRDNVGGNKMDLVQLETYLSTVGTDVGANQVDFSIPPASFFANFIPATDNGMFESEDWHLRGTDPLNTAFRGYDLSSDLFYSFTWDKDGNGRNAPWSIGAYEKQ